jgi:exosortase A-associated hydrolase 1
MEQPVKFKCNNKWLYGILHIPEENSNPSYVVLLITGGPQVRTGAHRLYVQLSRFLCEHNWSSMRFDYEGMGDSEGDFVGFRHAEASITSAIDFLHDRFANKPSIILWSLCDGATASILYGAKHPEYITRMILCNPLVITQDGLARSTIKHYYIKKIFSKEFYRNIFQFNINIFESFLSLIKVFEYAYFKKRPKCNHIKEDNLPQLVIESLNSFSKPIRIILSTNDIVASNFQDELKQNYKYLKKEFKTNKLVNYFIPNADHTFVDPELKLDLFRITLKVLDEVND